MKFKSQCLLGKNTRLGFPILATMLQMIEIFTFLPCNLLFCHGPNILNYLSSWLLSSVTQTLIYSFADSIRDWLWWLFRAERRMEKIYSRKSFMIVRHIPFCKLFSLLKGGEKGQPHQSLVRATFSSFSRPSHQRNPRPSINMCLKVYNSLR